MVKETGVIIGAGKMARFYRPSQHRDELYVANYISKQQPELYLATVLVERGCKEIILFACLFDAVCGKLHARSLERAFRELPAPVYQTLIGTPVNLPVIGIKEFIDA